MELEYIDHTEYGVTPEQVNQIIKETDWEAFEDWWRENQMPRGLQCVELHCYPTMREYVEKILKDKFGEQDPKLKEPLFLLKCAIVIDDMIR